MSRKLLEFKHHLSSGCCMWSGIEDVYAARTKENVPEAFLFAMSSYGESIFLKSRDKQKPFMFSAADGRTRKTYDSIKDTLGLSYQISAGRTLSYALSSIRSAIDGGHPVILGPLDMYYLPYLSMYHKAHIPIHYITMAGYDDEKECVLIYDCDRIELQELPLKDLMQAWNIKKNAVGDKNGFIRYQLPKDPLNKYELADICLRQKAARQLCPKPNFAGVSAYERIAADFPDWKCRLTEKEYKNALASITEYFGTVPKLPNEIMGLAAEDDIRYQANYDRLGNVLIQLAQESGQKSWHRAGELFCLCGEVMEDITNHLVSYCCKRTDDLTDIPSLFIKAGGYVKEAYEIIACTNEL